MASLAEDLLGPPERDRRPTHRSQCRGGMRPCPFVSCKWHLYLDVHPDSGRVTINWERNGHRLEPWEIPVSCALDVAETNAGATLEHVGFLLNMSRERVRQVEARAFSKLKHKGKISRALELDRGKYGKVLLPEMEIAGEFSYPLI